MTRTIACVIYPGGQSLDVAGPMEVFALASRQAAEDAAARGTRADALYTLRFVAHDVGPVRMASGLTLVADADFATPADDVDTLLVMGGHDEGLAAVLSDEQLLGYLRDAASRVRRIGSVCSGALVLAAAGVLDGRRATTHWRDVATLARHATVKVEPDAIYVADGAVWSSAGVTAGMDMALAMVSADHGLPLALSVAKRMVMVTKRAGGQSQFSRMLDAQGAPNELAAIVAELRADLRRTPTVEALAERVHLSPRQFRRRFVEAFGDTPLAYLQALRVEAAKGLLEHTTQGMKRIAEQCGFADEAAMRRAFVRACGVRPLDYRARFGPPGG